MLDEGTWVMPGCPCFPRYTRIHIKVWNCRADDAGRLREEIAGWKATLLKWLKMVPCACETISDGGWTCPRCEVLNGKIKIEDIFERASLPAKPSEEGR